MNKPSLKTLTATLWQARLYMSLGLIAGALLASALLLTAIPATKAQITIAPAHTLNESAGLGMQAQQASSALFQALSVVTNAPQNKHFQEFLILYHSPAIAAYLLQDEKLADKLGQDHRFTFTATTTNKTWTPERLSAYIRRNIKAQSILSAEFKQLTYWHPDPQFAKNFLQQLHKLTDNHIKHAAQNAAQKRRAYLQQQWSTTTNAQHQRLLTTLMLEQERTLMLSAIEEPFAAKPLSPPSAHYKAGWPAKAFLILTCLIIGAALGFGAYSVRHEV